jgi:hypothetical protein
MSEPWNLTEAQRRQIREAHAEAKLAGAPKLATQYGIRWPTGSVFCFGSRELAEAALGEDPRRAGVLVVHEIEPGTPNATEWREVED